MNPHAVKLFPEFDPEALRHDLALLAGTSRAPQPGTDHDGSWKGISLFNQGADHEFAGTVKHGSRVLRPYATQLLARTDTFRDIVERLGTIQRARLLELPAGAVIEEHIDPGASIHQRVCRIHVAVVTHPDVDFLIAGQPVRFEVGEMWYADFTQLHSVHNRSCVDRVHFVIDAIVTEKLLALFPPAFLEECRERLGDFHVVPTAHAPEAVGPDLDTRFRAAFTLPEPLVDRYQGRRARVRWDQHEGAYRLMLDGTPGRLLFAVDERTLELEDGRLTLCYAFEGGTPCAVSVRHYRSAESHRAEIEADDAFEGKARLAFGTHVTELPVVDSSDLGGTFRGGDLDSIRVHDRVNVEILRGTGGTAELRTGGEVHWRDLTSPHGLFGVRYDRDGSSGRHDRSGAQPADAPPEATTRVS